MLNNFSSIFYFLLKRGNIFKYFFKTKLKCQRMPFLSSFDTTHLNLRETGSKRSIIEQ